MARVFCALLVLAFAHRANSIFVIKGSGTTTISGVMQTLGFAYQSLDKESITSYTITSSGSGQNNALAGSTDWGGTNSILPKTAMAGRSYPSNTAYKFNSMIHSADALLPSYNIPGFTFSYSGTNPLTGLQVPGTLTIDQIGLFRIWNNNITWWNDTYLVGCGGGIAASLADGQINPQCGSPLNNPGLANVRERIRTVYRPDPAGTTVVWMINFQSIASRDNNGLFGYKLTTYTDVNGVATAGSSSFVALKANTLPDVNSYPFWNPCCCCDAWSVCDKKTYGEVGCKKPPIINNTQKLLSDKVPLKDACPSMSSCQPYMIPASVSTFHSATRILTTPYANGYLARPIGVPYGATYFNMHNRALKPVTPAYANVYAALSSPSITPAGKANEDTLDLSLVPDGKSLMGCVDSTLVDAFPLVEYNVVNYNNNIDVNCYRALAIIQFLVWSFASDAAVAAMAFLQSVQPPTATVSANLAQFSLATCGYSGQFFVFDTIFPYERQIFVAAVVMAALFWTLGLVVLYHHRHPAIRRAGVVSLFVASLVFGINFFTVLLWLGFPTLPICQARPWVAAVSFVTIYGAIVYLLQDRIFNRLDMDSIIDSTLGSHSIEAAAEMKAVGNSIAASGSSRHSGTSVEGDKQSQSSADTLDNPVKAMSWRAVLVLLVGVFNFLIPIIWQAVEPPTVQTRQCMGSFAEGFKQAMLFYNCILVVVFVLGGLANGARAQATTYPIHFFLVAVSLWVPLNFLRVDGASFAIPQRSFLDIALGPAVGIVCTTSIIGAFTLFPPLWRAFTVSAEDEIGVLMIESQVDAYSTRSKHSLSQH